VHRSAYGTLTLPCGIINQGTGPTVLLMGGIHGDEYEAQVAFGRLFRTISASSVRGRLIFFPSINLPATLAQTRTSPLDGLNLNRIFPGDPDGTPSQQIAYFIETVLAPISDVWFDFHSGGTSLNYLPLAARHTSADPGINSRTEALLKAFGAPLSMVWGFFDEPRMAKGCAERNGIVYLASEFGGGGTISIEGTDLCFDGSVRALVHLGVLDPDAIKVPPAAAGGRTVTVRSRNDHIYASCAGVFVPSRPLGAEISAGEQIGEIVQLDRLDAHPEPVISAVSGLLVCLRHPAQVERGDCVAHLAGDVPH
jgi:predicted deacylase